MAYGFSLMTKRTNIRFLLAVRHSFDSKAVLRVVCLPSSHTVLLRILEVVMCGQTSALAKGFG
jgi:hypothetical protein